jgi:hypothetical protein
MVMFWSDDDSGYKKSLDEFILIVWLWQDHGYEIDSDVSIHDWFGVYFLEDLLYFLDC